MELSLTELDMTEQLTLSLSKQVIYPADMNWNSEEVAFYIYIYKYINL